MIDKIQKLISKLLGIGFVIFLVATCLFFTQFFVVMGYSEFSAHSLAPPEYPNSKLLDKWKSGGSDSGWDRRTYQTSDSVGEVLSFMEKQMPGFTSIDDPTRGVVYQNYASNTNWLAQRAAKAACTSLYCIEKSALTYPSASVSFYSDPDNPTNTLIEVWISWPTQ